MSKIRLGVNIDHVATVRNARGESYPSPLRAAITAQKNGADSVTIHLREDRRHINETDLKKIKSKLNIEIIILKRVMIFKFNNNEKNIFTLRFLNSDIRYSGLIEVIAYAIISLLYSKLNNFKKYELFTIFK